MRKVDIELEGGSINVNGQTSIVNVLELQTSEDGEKGVFICQSNYFEEDNNAVSFLNVDNCKLVISILQNFINEHV
jgi:hypothetical protein